MIEARQLVRRYGDFTAVDSVSFSIEPGQVVGLLGHNGAGKTTIMKMLTGFLEPSAGQVLVDGVDVQQQPLTVQAQIGYLPENLPIYPEMTVAEYLAYAAALRGCDAANAVPWAIEQTQLQAKATDPIDTLSRGYKQRVGVAQAILHRPKFLILDEPSNGLDPNQIQHMRDLIKQLATSATVLLSTHIMQEVSAVCDRTLILANGKLVLDEQLGELQRAREIRLRSSDSLNSAALTQLSGVDHVQTAAAGEWLIKLDPEGNLADTCADIARQVHEQGQPLFQLNPEVRDLERIFAEVNEADMEVADAV